MVGDGGIFVGVAEEMGVAVDDGRMVAVCVSVAVNGRSVFVGIVWMDLLAHAARATA